MIFRLLEGPQRFSALQRSLSPITQTMLTATLRGLEADGLVWRRVEGSVPPHVTFGLTDRATALTPVVDALAVWWRGIPGGAKPPAEVRDRPPGPWHRSAIG